MNKTHLESIDFHMRTMARALDRRGVPSKDAYRAVNTMSFDTEAERFAAWATESIYAGLREAMLMERADRRIVFRCAAQAREYRGRIGGFWPGPAVADAYATLEDVIYSYLVGT